MAHQKLQELLQYVQKHSPFYKEELAAFNFDKPLSSELISSLPFTTKQDISARNQDFLCVTRNEIADYVTTSGTTGEPITIFLTKQDLHRLARNEKESLELAGVKKGDAVQLMTTIDKQFMAGLAYYLGVQEIGAGIIRIGPGVPALQWKSIFQNEPRTLIAVPSFIVNLLDYAKSNNIDFQGASVESIVCIGEPIREDSFNLNILGKRITEQWNVDLFSTYASTEMGTAFTECSVMQGKHLNAELLHLEVIDENNKAAKNGEVGEIVISTLGVEGTPLIRYKTGDLARIHYDNCSCGRKTPRLGPILGRKNQMIKYKGTTIFPKAIYAIFDVIPEITCYKIEIAKDYLGNDSITILLEKRIENAAIIPQILEECKSKLRVIPHLVFLETNYLRSQVYKKNSRKPEKIVFKS